MGRSVKQWLETMSLVSYYSDEYHLYRFDQEQN